MFQVLDSRNRQETKKIESMTKKGHQKFWASKMEIVSLKKVIRKFGPRIFLLSSQTRRKVSAHELCICISKAMDAHRINAYSGILPSE